MPREPRLVTIDVDARWRTRMWATGSPAYSWCSEAQVRVVVAAATPLRVVGVYRSGSMLNVAKSTGRGTELVIPIGEWISGPTVGQGRGAPLLRRPPDPERSDPWGELGVPRPLAAQTWSEFLIHSNGDHSMSLFAIARQDTELRPSGHWRIRPDLVNFVPEELGVLRGPRSTWKRFTEL